MVDTIQTIQEIGFRQEVTEGVSPITAAVPPLHFGFYETTWGKFPQYLQDVQAYYRGQSYDPYRKSVSKTSVIGQVSYVPVDSVMWYLGLGNATGDNVDHVVTGINSGDVPSWSMRYESSNGTDFHRKDVVNARVKRLSSSINFLQPDNFLVNNLTYIGANQIDEASLTDNQRISPVYADTGLVTTSAQPYRVDNNFVLNWDQGGDNVDLKNLGLDFNYILDTMNRVRHIKGQKYGKWVTTGNRVHGIGFRFLRKGVTDVFDDYVGQVAADTFKDFRLKIYNSATNYLQFDFTNVSINKCELNHAMIENNEEAYYEMEMLPETVTVTTRDGVDKSFYGDY
jgi:hypothetical protein